MTFEDAIRESIRKYYEDGTFENYNKASGKEVKYTPEYFDSVEEEMLSNVKSKKKTGDMDE